MPNIIFASNNVAHFPMSVPDSNTDRYDVSRVPYAITLSNYMESSSPVFAPVAGDETWFHFRYLTYTRNFERSDLFFRSFDAAGNQLFSIRKRQNTSALQPQIYLYDGATTLNQISNSSLVQSLINTLDIRYKATALLIEVELFINQASVANLQFNANPNNYGNPVKFSIGTGFTEDLSASCYFSEFLVADGDTRNGRLNLLRPLAAGAYEQWNGSLGVLADDDTTTGLTTIAAGQRQTMTLTPYTGAENISNLVAVSSTTRGQNSPTQLSHTVRLSTVDYDGPPIPIGYPLEYHVTDFKVNPATSLPWTASDLTNIETGFISIA